MKLNEFNMKPTSAAKKALKEHFGTDLNVDSLGLYDTNRMLRKVKGFISEMKASGKAQHGEQNPAYLKAVFMEQALTHHYGELKALPMYNQRMVVENEEVEKSQVILAAQEMVDSMQKMIEQVSDMLVKELPAVVDGVNSEVGTSEGETFQSQATEALTSVQAALTQSQGTLKSALNSITGQGGDMMGDEMGGMGGEEDLGGEMGGEELGGEMGGEELGAEPDLGAEMPEEEPEMEPNIGRATR
jgi:hypothetical protein